MLFNRVLISIFTITLSINADENLNNLNITIPTPPSVTPVVKLNIINGNEDISDRSIKFSKRYPPNYIPLEKRVLSKGDIEKIGDINNGRVAVNLVGDFLSVEEVKNRLKKIGFEILAVMPLDKSKDLVSIVFTNRKLKSLASRPKRGFISNLRVVVDKKRKEISFINPLYILKAFLQDDFDIKSAKEILLRITKEFPNLQNSADKSKFQTLPNYQFMEGMPKYDDMIEVGDGKNLSKKIESNKNIAFKQKLDDNSTLIGVKLSDRISAFPNMIGRKNAGLLPYPILIEGDKAYILDPKYYISVMYPDLKMAQFMKVGKLPMEIIKECKKIFK